MILYTTQIVHREQNPTTVDTEIKMFINENTSFVSENDTVYTEGSVIQYKRSVWALSEQS